MDTPYRIMEVVKYNGKKEYHLQKSWYSYMTGNITWHNMGIYTTLEQARKERDIYIGKEIKSSKVIE